MQRTIMTGVGILLSVLIWNPAAVTEVSGAESPGPGDFGTELDKMQQQRRHRRQHGKAVITGRVVNARTQEPIPAANVLIEDTYLGAATDARGRFRIIGVPVGTYTITASVIGYQSHSKDLTIQSPDEYTLEFALQESALESPGVVVTGTRTRRHIKDVPVLTEVITPQRFTEKGAETLYESLRGEPGLQVEQRCSACNFSTIRMQGLESGHTQVLIDGMPTFSGLTGVYGLQQIPTADIERIEIVKGAGSALYGSNAIAGVVNVITKQPEGSPTAKVTLQAGEYGTNLLSINASHGRDDLNMTVNAQKNTGNAIDTNGDGLTDRVRSDNITTGVRVKWAHLLGDDEMTVAGHTINETRQGGDLTGDAWKNPFAPGSETIETSRYELKFGYHTTFPAGNSLQLEGTRTRHHRSATNDAFLTDYQATHEGQTPPTDLMRPYLAEEHQYVADLQYTQPLTSTLRLLAGGQYRGDRMQETGMYCLMEEVPALQLHAGEPYQSISEKRADNYGAFLQGEWSPLPGINMVFGARYDAHQSTDQFAGTGQVARVDIPPVTYDEQVVNPRAAVKVEPLRNLILRMSLGTGYRVPYTFEEDLHLCSGSPRVYKPADLQPETSQSGNVSAVYTLLETRGQHKVSVNLFRTNLQGKIGFVNAKTTMKSQGYDYQWQNIGDAFTQGLELGWQSAFSPRFRVEGSLTYTDAQYGATREDWTLSSQAYRELWVQEFGEEQGEHLFQQWCPVYRQAADRSRFIPRDPRLSGSLTGHARPGNWQITCSAEYTGAMYLDYFLEGAVPAEIKHTSSFWMMSTRIAYTFDSTFTGFVGAKNLGNYVQQDRRPDDAAFIWGPLIGRTWYAGLSLEL